MKKEFIIKNKDNIIVIRRKQVYKLIHEKEQYIKGLFPTTLSLDGDPVAPMFHFPESYYVVLQNGDKHILNKEQYKELKRWF